MTDIPMRTSLQSAPRNPPTKEQLRGMRQRAWLEQGIAVLDPQEINCDVHKQAVINEANRQFGKRPKKNGGSR